MHNHPVRSTTRTNEEEAIMNITDVQVKPSTDGNKRCLAYAACVFEREFVVHNMRLIKVHSGVVLAMPDEQYNGEYRDVAHPITNALREQLRNAVVEEYNRVIDGHEPIEAES
jgi:stage V sporulation protein G